MEGSLINLNCPSLHEERKAKDKIVEININELIEIEHYLSYKFPNFTIFDVLFILFLLSSLL